MSDSLWSHGLFSRPEYYSGQLFASPGDLPIPGIEPRSPALQADSLPAEPPGKPLHLVPSILFIYFSMDLDYIFCLNYPAVSESLEIFVCKPVFLKLSNSQLSTLFNMPGTFNALYIHSLSWLIKEISHESLGVSFCPLGTIVKFSSVTQSCLTLRSHRLQHTRLPCLSPTPRACPNSYPSIWWCHPTISSSVVLFSCFQSCPESGSFPMSQLFASGGQNIRVSASASVLPMNTRDWFTLGWTGWIFLQSKGLSRVFSNTTVQKHQCFNAQPSL